MPEEISSEMGISLAKVRHIMKISQETVSLEAPVGDDDEDSTLGEFIEDDKGISPVQDAASLPASASKPALFPGCDGRAPAASSRRH